MDTKQQENKSKCLQETVLEADDSGQFSIQEEDDLVVVGADIEGLYPSLPNVEVAVIVYKVWIEV